MSDQELKPLIFLHPLSKTLTKLREIMKEDAESEGIEIHDVESIEEATQIIPILGQSLVMGASPKQIAMVLQKNKRFIKKSETKVMMLTTKSLPPRTLEKFMKIGLTECIVEPVNPKTLLYKVRLQIKSIKTKEEENEMELQRSKIKEKAEEEARKRKDRKMAIDDEDEPTITQERTSERINSNYEGKSSKASEEGGHNKNESNYKEEAKNGHYKGNVASRAINEDEKEDESDHLEEQSDLEGLTQEAAKSEEEKKGRRSNFKEDKLGGHYQGDFKSENKDEVKKDKQDSIGLERDDLEDNHEKIGDLFEAEKEEIKPKEREEDDAGLMKGVLDSIEEEEKEEAKKAEKDPLLDESDNNSSTQGPEEEKGPMAGTGGTDNLGGDLGGSGRTDHIKNEDNKGNVEKEEDIDGFLRGGLASKEDTPEKGSKKAPVSGKLKDEEEKKKKQLDEKLEKEKKPLNKLENKDKDSHTPKIMSPDIEDIEDNQEKVDLNFEDSLKKNKKEEIDQGEKSAPRTSFQEEQKGNMSGSSASTENKKDNNNKSNAKSDKINTHYSNKSSTSHNENDLGNSWQASQKKPEDDFKKENKSNETDFEFQKEKEGETLDYSKIKEQFEAMEYGSVAKDDSPYQFEIAKAEIKVTNKAIVDANGELVRMDFEEINDEEESELIIYEPDSKGLEHMISVLETYYKKSAPPSHTLERISQKMFTLYESDVVFYQHYNHKFIKMFNGFISNRITQPERDDFNNEDHYSEAIQNYNDNKNIYNDEWNDIEGAHIDFWQTCKVPTWSDPKFKTEENIFIFPYYMGGRCLGFAVVKPQGIINEENSALIEILSESARGIYQTNKEKEPVKKETKQEKKPSALKSLWGKLAG